MDVSSAPTRYAEALLFAAEVVEAATHPPRGDHGEEVLRDPCAQKLLRHQSDWSWCDNRQDVDLAAGGALRATVEHLAYCHATALPDHTGRAGEHWPDVDNRLTRLASALRCAAKPLMPTATVATRFPLMLSRIHHCTPTRTPSIASADTLASRSASNRSRLL
ncbi:hypothetical protein [Micromonospora halophytica]|uniref:hypothetical protein n=1 Tax=Micromonospora halophytica TaxID=47864 RepID=UPI001112C8DE|nr:hypothetical protein [Micromonospora halophytica]